MLNKGNLKGEILAKICLLVAPIPRPAGMGRVVALARAPPRTKGDDAAAGEGRARGLQVRRVPRGADIAHRARRVQQTHA